MSVDSLISDAQSYAEQTFADASANIDSATSTINGVTSTSVSFQLPFIPEIAKFEAAIAPGLNATNFQLPQKPAAIAAPIDMPSPLDGIMAGPSDLADPPEIDFDGIAKPSALPGFNSAAPFINTSFAFPTAPDIIMPPAPIVVDREVPEKPDVLLPTFEGVKPADIAAAPTDYAERFTAAYREAAPSMVSALEGQIDAMLSRYNPQYSAQMAAIEAKLSTYLAGGTALTPAVENAIYERAKDKTSAEYRRTRDAAYADAAKRGFTLPNGVLVSSVQRARQDGADNNARASTEIAVKMAELEQQNMQFAVTTSTNLRVSMLSAALSYHSNLVSLNGQALDYAKSILNAIIEVFNTMVREYQARLEGYKAEAQVFDARMRGAMASIELYKAEIDALQALTQVDVAKVSMYRERIAGLMALVEVYKVRVDAVVSKASLEKLKLELFSEQVRAYSAQTQAKSAEWQAYSAAVSGEEAKARVYGAQVEAYRAQWGAYSTQVQAKGEQLRAIAVTNEARAQYGVAKVQEFTALVGAEATRVEAEINFQSQLLQQYSIANQAASSAFSASAEAYKAMAQTTLSAGELSISAIMQSAQLDLGRAKAIADTALATGQVYAGMAGAALSGMNTLVSKSE